MRHSEQSLSNSLDRAAVESAPFSIRNIGGPSLTLATSLEENIQSTAVIYNIRC